MCEQLFLKYESSDVVLTRLFPVFHFFPPENIRNLHGFPLFLGCIEM